MRARGAYQQGLARLRLAGCPYRIRQHPTRSSPYLYVYETCRGGKHQVAKAYRLDQDSDVEDLVSLLLEAHRNLQRGGVGLNWDALNRRSTLDGQVLETWGEIRAAIKADIAPGGPKARDRNPFSCFSDRGYFGRHHADDEVALPEHLERFCLFTPASLDARRRHPAVTLEPRCPNAAGFQGVIQMVKYLQRKGFAVATPELVAKLEQLKRSAGRPRLPSPRYIPTTEDLQDWLDAVQAEDPLRGWVVAVIATYGLRPHEVWHIERLPGECREDPTFLQICSFEGEARRATKTGHRFALPLPEAWLERYRLVDVQHSRCMLEALRRRHPIRIAEASDGGVQVWNNADLGRVVVHWLRNTAKPSREIGPKLLGWHQPPHLPGRRAPKAVQGRCRPYDLRHAWAIRARETTTWSTRLKAQAMGHSEAIHARRYLVEQTAQQVERGMVLQKALDEGRPQERPMVVSALPEGVTPELIALARQLIELKTA